MAVSDLYEKNGAQANHVYKIKDKDIIEKFGGHPHRNKIIGGRNADEELEFLKLPNSGF
mgnify:CR=1 FL=1